MRRPNAAERARTMAYGIAGGALVTAEQDASPAIEAPCEPVAAHVTDPSGRPLLLLPTASPAVAELRRRPDQPVALWIWDLAPVPLADRLRGRAWLRGRLTALDDSARRDAVSRLWHLHARSGLPAVQEGHGPWTVLAMEVTEAEIADAWGHAVLEAQEYRAARPDPFVVIEHGMLTHLDHCHRAELTALFTERFGLAAEEGSVRPLALDRHGLWLRRLDPHADDGGPLDLYVEFPAPVRDLHGLRSVCRRLLSPAAP